MGTVDNVRSMMAGTLTVIHSDSGLRCVLVRFVRPASTGLRRTFGSHAVRWLKRAFPQYAGFFNMPQMTHFDHLAPRRGGN